MYKKGTILIRYKIDDASSIGIGSIVRLEENAKSKYDNCLITRLKVVVIPGRTDTNMRIHGVNLGDFKPVPTLLQRKHKWNTNLTNFLLDTKLTHCALIQTSEALLKL